MQKRKQQIIQKNNIQKMRKTKNIQNTYKQKKTQTQNTKPPLKNNSKEKDWKEGRKQGTHKNILAKSLREKRKIMREI